MAPAEGRTPREFEGVETGDAGVQGAEEVGGG